MNGNGATMPTVDVERLETFAASARKLTDHYLVAIRNALAHSVSLSMALGVDELAAQEAIERALVITAVGTFQARVTKQTGRPASFRDACNAMAAMIDEPDHKPGEAEPGPNVLQPAD